MQRLKSCTGCACTGCACASCACTSCACAFAPARSHLVRMPPALLLLACSDQATVRALVRKGSKFESPTFIEHRVATHEAGALSGSVVALDALADIDMLADCDYHVSHPAGDRTEQCLTVASLHFLGASFRARPESSSRA